MKYFELSENCINQSSSQPVQCTMSPMYPNIFPLQIWKVLSNVNSVTFVNCKSYFYKKEGGSCKYRPYSAKCLMQS